MKKKTNGTVANLIPGDRDSKGEQQLMARLDLLPGVILFES